VSVTEVIIRLALVALLVSYLLFRQWQRDRQRIGPTNPAEWTGKGIDVTPIKPTLEEVRRCYPRPPRSGSCLHRNLLVLARRTVAHFEYFQEHEPTDKEEKHAH
jgi:hypothetical protein